jgi:hypothetical protein
LRDDRLRGARLPVALALTGALLGHDRNLSGVGASPTPRARGAGALVRIRAPREPGCAREPGPTIAHPSRRFAGLGPHEVAP